MNKEQTTQSTANQQPATTKGILLIALGAPEYGNMAANLAASIRVKDPDIAIHLVYSHRSITQLGPQHLALFSSMAECPQEYYTRSESTQATQPTTDNRQPATTSPDFIRPKTCLYELSPFEETLFLDVDMLLLPLRPVSETMAALSAACDYTIKNRGYSGRAAGYTHWFDVAQARSQLKKPKARFYQSQSEFLFFKKNKRMKKFFATVRDVFDHPPVESTGFRGGVPDEYAYNLAMALTGIYPHRDHYIPVYWSLLDGRRDWNKEIIRDYIGFSIGGESIPEWIQQKINAYKDYFRKELKLAYLFNVPGKRRWKKQMVF